MGKNARRSHTTRGASSAVTRSAHRPAVPGHPVARGRCAVAPGDLVFVDPFDVGHYPPGLVASTPANIARGGCSTQKGKSSACNLHPRKRPRFTDSPAAVPHSRRPGRGRPPWYSEPSTARTPTLGVGPAASATPLACCGEQAPMPSRPPVASGYQEARPKVGPPKAVSQLPFRAAAVNTAAGSKSTPGCVRSPPLRSSGRSAIAPQVG